MGRFPTISIGASFFDRNTIHPQPNHTLSYIFTIHAFVSISIPISLGFAFSFRNSLFESSHPEVRFVSCSSGILVSPHLRFLKL
ncbi:hypothetical protein RJT34_24819 [Clitoria ternatea]|uniref:Uncharacterized protein n=1 Tax=Clitoria ternatea TaxID=43366 RepID=A0AAN9FNL8_CLITE